MAEFDIRTFMVEAPWAADANCLGLDPELFFPERGQSTLEAKAICRACDVQAECLAFALNNGEKFGIWGGLSERDRRTATSDAASLAFGPVRHLIPVGETA